MGVSRATFGRIVQRARKTIADALINGRIKADGGGIKVQLLVVDVAAQSVTDRIALTLSSRAEVKRQIPPKLATLFAEDDDGAEVEEIPVARISSPIKRLQRAFDVFFIDVFFMI